MMESIAGMAMDMKAAEFANNFAIAVTKKMMDTQELAAQEVMNLLPDAPAAASAPAGPALGQYIDTYA